MTVFDQLADQAQLAPAYRVVIVVVLALASVALAFCTVLVVHHGFTSVRRRRRAQLMRRATPFLAPHVASGNRLRAAVSESRRRYGDWATAIVLREARREVIGECTMRLTAELVEMGEVTRLRRMLGSRREWRRVQAARELGQCGGDESRDALIEATGDKSPVVRRAARDGLLGDGHPSSVTTAIASYREDAPRGLMGRRSFYAQLAGASSTDLLALLESGTLDRDDEKLALEALGEARVPEALFLVRDRLDHADPEIRATAARVAGRLADAASAPALVRMLADPEWFVRAAAAKAFASIKADEAAFEALRVSLSDGAWWVRANAANALAQQGDAGFETLLDALEGDDAFSRDAGLAALGHAVMSTGARRRLENALARLPEDSQAAPLRRLLESVPGPRPVARLATPA